MDDINTNYLTISEFATELKYVNSSFLTRKVKKLKLGYKIKGVVFLSKEDQEILKKSIKRKE